MSRWSDSELNQFYPQEDKVATDTSPDIGPETTGAIASETEVSMERFLALILNEQPNLYLNPHFFLEPPLPFLSKNISFNSSTGQGERGDCGK